MIHPASTSHSDGFSPAVEASPRLKGENCLRSAEASLRRLVSRIELSLRGGGRRRRLGDEREVCWRVDRRVVGLPRAPARRSRVPKSRLPVFVLVISGTRPVVKLELLLLR